MQRQGHQLTLQPEISRVTLGGGGAQPRSVVKGKEPIESGGQQRGRTDVPQPAGVKRKQAEAPVESAGQRRGRIDTPQAAGGKGKEAEDVAIETRPDLTKRD